MNIHFTICSIFVGWLEKQNEGCSSGMVNGVTRISPTLISFFCVIFPMYGFVYTLIVD